MNITTYCRDEFILIVAGLVREGLHFDALRTDFGLYTITLTGGY